MLSLAVSSIMRLSSFLRLPHFLSHLYLWSRHQFWNCLHFLFWLLCWFRFISYFVSIFEVIFILEFYFLFRVIYMTCTNNFKVRHRMSYPWFPSLIIRGIINQISRMEFHDGVSAYTWKIFIGMYKHLTDKTEIT